MTAVPVWAQYGTARRWWFLAVLFLVSLCNYVDRQVLSILIEPIKAEFALSDAQMGLLTGFAFAAVYAVLGLPVARLADRGDRRLVIGVSIALWSAMTMACGAAASFVQLFMARMGVGIGEAGAIPPAQSLIADYFPPEQRSRALAIFMVSAAGGYFAAFLGGAQIAAAYGWRSAFVALGAPGLVLALIAGFGLDEPRRRLPRMAAAASESFVATLRVLAAKPSYVLLTIAVVLYFVVSYGAVTWFPAYLQRVLKLSMLEVGARFGTVSAITAILGTIAGGVITDRLARRDPRWLAWVPGAALLAAWPAYIAGLISDDIDVFLGFAFIGGFCIAAAIPALFAALHAVCGSPRRAMAVAIVFFFANLLGLGFGPLLTGAASDWFSARHGAVGLRYALLGAISVLLPCGLILFSAGRRIAEDLEA